MSARRPVLLPLAPLYAAGLRLKEALQAQPRHLNFPVISIGSISAGGAGKTPLTLLLIRLLQQQGKKPIVLSRGYKREGSGIELVQPHGDAARFGDEPLMLATQTGAPVYVGSDRYTAGTTAEKDAPQDTIFLLDDGFQHRRLARDLDIVLLTEQDTNDILLPAGDLREPLRALRRADIIVLREEETARLEPLLPRWINSAKPPAVWHIRRKLSFVGAVPKRPLAFCGIARPESFLKMLRTAGCDPVGDLVFRDHHAYIDSDLDRLIERAQHHHADSFITTEKDAVKLTPEMRRKLESLFPISIARLDVELLEAESAIADLLASLHRPTSA